MVFLETREHKMQGSYCIDDTGYIVIAALEFGNQVVFYDMFDTLRLRP